MSAGVRCSTPRCRAESEMVYAGRPICGRCWEHLCAADDDEHPRMLARIGLARDEAGRIVEASR